MGMEGLKHSRSIKKIWILLMALTMISPILQVVESEAEQQTLNSIFLTSTPSLTELSDQKDILAIPFNNDSPTAETTVTNTPGPTPERKIIPITNPPTDVPTPLIATATPNPWETTEYPPTCEEAGYFVRENVLDGHVEIVEGLPALGHEFGEWEKGTMNGMMVTTCIRCGKEIRSRTAYSGTIPRIDLTGSMEGISKSNRITLRFDFASPTDNFSCFSYTTWQGHNSLEYPKKNYTIRLYDNEAISEKHKLKFKGWQREHKYVLKANYRDVSQTRNLVAAHLWADMVKSRPNLFETLRHTSNYGAVDGFPVIVYVNGEFDGLYTMNLHIDDDLYQMDNVLDAIMIANSTEPEETRFQAEAMFTDQKNAWEVEYCGSGEDEQWAKDRLNELIHFVINSNDDDFREHLRDYLDVDGALDYLIFLYVTGLQNNAAKDLVLLKYHDCDVWIPTVYDMERAFGLALDGTEYISPETFLPSRTPDTWNSETGSLLWDRIWTLFGKEIRDRYVNLRQTILTEEELIRRIDQYMEEIPNEYFEQDLQRYPRRIPEGKPGEQMKEYIHQRLWLLDRLFTE